MKNKTKSLFLHFIEGLEEVYSLLGVLIIFTIVLTLLGTIVYIPFHERSIKKEIELKLTALAPSISEIKSKLIEVKNNPNLINFDNKDVNLTIQNSKEFKNEKRIFFKIKNSFICEEVYNMTNEIFKINHIIMRIK